MKLSRRLTALALCMMLMIPVGQAATWRSPWFYRWYSTQQATVQMTAASGWRDDFAGEVARQVNEERAKAGLSGLRVDAELTRAARVRATEIAQKFSHTRPDGSSWSTVSESAFGENIAVGQQTPDKVMAAWLTSEGHRANILRGTYGSIGVACYVTGGVVYWVQLFGR